MRPTFRNLLGSPPLFRWYSPPFIHNADVPPSRRRASMHLKCFRFQRKANRVLARACSRLICCSINCRTCFPAAMRPLMHPQQHALGGFHLTRFSLGAFVPPLSIRFLKKKIIIFFFLFIFRRVAASPPQRNRTSQSVKWINYKHVDLIDSCTVEFGRHFVWSRFWENYALSTIANEQWTSFSFFFFFF